MRVVRPAPDDFKAVCQLDAAATSENGAGLLPPACLVGLDADPYPQQWFGALATASSESARSRIFMAVDDGDVPVGLATAFIEAKKRGLIAVLRVRKHAQRRGVGSALFAACTEWFAQRDVRTFDMWIQPDDVSLTSFASKHGGKPGAARKMPAADIFIDEVAHTWTKRRSE